MFSVTGAAQHGGRFVAFLAHPLSGRLGQDREGKPDREAGAKPEGVATLTVMQTRDWIRSFFSATA